MVYSAPQVVTELLILEVAAAAPAHLVEQVADLLVDRVAKAL
jgi:hypothetical protein